MPVTIVTLVHHHIPLYCPLYWLYGLWSHYMWIIHNGPTRIMSTENAMNNWVELCHILLQYLHIDGLMHQRCNSSALAMELHHFALTHQYGVTLICIISKYCHNHKKDLTHWVLVKYICISKLFHHWLNQGLVPIQYHAITWISWLVEFQNKLTMFLTCPILVFTYLQRKENYLALESPICLFFTFIGPGGAMWHH